ncbi:Protein ILM1 [Spathaspora sp. JA1]|nr:Protein ILM1 [Spathaspora sp. JA1]
MQFLTAKSLLYVRVIFLFTISFYLINDPEVLSTAGFVILLGQAMRVPILHLEKSNPVLAIAAIAFFSLGLGDVIPLLAENTLYFESVLPIRVAGFMILAAYVYIVPTSILSNSLVLTFAFFEFWLNFLIYNNLRDEKYYKMKKFVEENGEEIQRVQGEQVRVVELDD